jgi:hypothetical protein
MTCGVKLFKRSHQSHLLKNVISVHIYTQRMVAEAKMIRQGGNEGVESV